MNWIELISETRNGEYSVKLKTSGKKFKKKIKYVKLWLYDMIC